MNRPGQRSSRHTCTLRAGFLAVLAATVCACASLPEATTGFTLRNASFEEGPAGEHCAPGWACVMHKDTQSFRFTVEDTSSPAHGKVLCIEPLKREPWALASESRFDAALRGKRIRLSLDVRVAGVEGAGAGPMMTSHGSRGETLRSAERLVKGTQDWQAVSAEMEVPQDAVSVEVGGVLNGRGRACFDNARVEVLP